MAGTNEVGFNGLTFAQNIPNIDIDTNLLNGAYVDQKNFTASTEPAFVGMSTEATAAAKTVDGFFALFSTAGLRLPPTYEGFVKAFREEYLQTANPSPRMGSVFDGFVTEYRDLLKIGGGPNDAVGGDWSPLSPVVGAAGIQQQFESTFSAFLASYPYPETGPGNNGPITTTDFFNNWYKFSTATATLGMTSAQITSYQQVYEGFGYPPSEFQNRLIAFYNEQVKETRTNRDPEPPNGYFIPSRSFGAWFDEMIKDYKFGVNNTFASVVTSVSGSQSKRVLILEKIFKLIVSMIDAIQKVAAAQAGGLNFLTQWQKSYVDRMNQVRTFVAKDGTRVENSDATSDEATARGDLNKTNSAYTEQLRANRDLVSDDAKALQSNVNQSNDAVTQQANIGTSIIQQFSTILGSIYR